jgi:hypothetical protein
VLWRRESRGGRGAPSPGAQTRRNLSQGEGGGGWAGIDSTAPSRQGVVGGGAGIDGSAYPSPSGRGRRRPAAAGEGAPRAPRLPARREGALRDAARPAGRRDMFLFLATLGGGAGAVSSGPSFTVGLIGLIISLAASSWRAASWRRPHRENGLSDHQHAAKPARVEAVCLGTAGRRGPRGRVETVAVPEAARRFSGRAALAGQIGQLHLQLRQANLSSPARHWSGRPPPRYACSSEECAVPGLQPRHRSPSTVAAELPYPGRPARAPPQQRVISTAATAATSSGALDETHHSVLRPAGRRRARDALGPRP